MTVESERVARLEERVARLDADVVELRRTSVSIEVFEARMAPLIDMVTEVRDEIKAKGTWRGGVLMPLSVSLSSGLCLAIVTYFLNH